MAHEGENYFECNLCGSNFSLGFIKKSRKQWLAKTINKIPSWIIFSRLRQFSVTNVQYILRNKYMFPSY